MLPLLGHVVRPTSTFVRSLSSDVQPDSDQQDMFHEDKVIEEWWREAGGRPTLDPRAVPPVPSLQRVLIPSVYVPRNEADSFGRDAGLAVESVSADDDSGRSMDDRYAILSL